MALLEPRVVELKDGRKAVVRHLEPADAPRLPDFMERIAVETTHTMMYVGRRFELKELEARLQRTHRCPASLDAGVFHDEVLVGALLLTPENQNHPWIRHCASFGMMLLKDYWGQGLGRRLLALMEEHAARRGLRRIEAAVRVENSRGMALYLSAGYRVEGLRRSAAYIDGRFEDEYVIAKLL
ncbi:MAG: GNAT family N-acetyltransferase [Elusimicrobiota bacterium]|jgi:RimJ/RimL family protein N-acetyltransferase